MNENTHSAALSAARAANPNFAAMTATEREAAVRSVRSTSVSWISRDWRNGVREFAEIGFDYEATANPWTVRTGRTASGEPMERTDEAMTVETVHHFATDRQASAWVAEGGYR